MADDKPWFRQPAILISILSASISAITLYLVQLRTGELKLVLPTAAGVVVTTDSILRLALPVTIANTGAVRQHRVISDIVATVDPRNDTVPPYTLRWRYDWAFVGRDQYFTKYSSKKLTVDTTFVDYLDYSAHAFPFLISGGASTWKVLGLTMEHGKADPLVGPFSLTVRVKMQDGDSVVGQAEYDCGERPLSAERTRWCPRNGY